MDNISVKKPKLLIGDYSKVVDVTKSIVNSNYFCTDEVVPMNRFRGTVIFAPDKINGDIKMMGWQRDVTRMRKMDVSLPFILSVTISKDGIIKGIEVDKLFNGGKGILCSRKYLDALLKDTYIGMPIDKSFIQKVKLDTIHCFHLYEVLCGIYSYYNFLKEEVCFEESSENFYFEEEVVDCRAEDGNLYISGIHKFFGKEKVEYTMVLYDVFSKITFIRNGNMRFVDAVKTEFYLNDKLLHSDLITQSENDYMFTKLQKFLIKCVSYVKDLLYPGNRIRMMNTNLTPGAFIGIIIQSIAMRAFKDNYNYALYVFTALQRPNDIPGCIGSVLSDEEAHLYFPNYDLNQII